MAEAFAQHTDGAANIIIVGRNESVAKEIIASFPKPSNATVVHEFVKCDATSMKEIGAAAEAIRSKVPKVDYLVLSPGYLALEGRVETEEGIDRKMAVNYYGRWKFVNDLVPLFNKEGAKVLSVLGAGVGAEIDVEDLAMKKNYSVARVGVVTPTYNDLMNEVCSNFILFPFRVTGSDTMHAEFRCATSETLFRAVNTRVRTHERFQDVPDGDPPLDGAARAGTRVPMDGKRCRLGRVHVAWSAVHETRVSPNRRERAGHWDEQVFRERRAEGSALGAYCADNSEGHGELR